MSEFLINISFQVARVLHLMYRLVVQPNTFRAHTFADSFISCGGVETLLVLLQREAKAGNDSIAESSGGKVAENVSIESSVHETNKSKEKSHDDHVESLGEKEYVSHEEGSQLQSSSTGDSSIIVSAGTNIGRTPSSSENQLIRNLGGISFSITADSARSNVYNVDNGDGIVVGIIHLLGALLTSGHLKFSSNVASLHLPSNLLSNGLPDEGSAMFYDKISLVLFALQKAFQAEPQRLMTYNVYMALLGAAVWIAYLFSFVSLSVYVCMHVLSLLFTTTTATTAITTTKKPQFCKSCFAKNEKNTKEIKIKKNNSYL